MKKTAVHVFGSRKMEKLISVIVPVFNVQTYLKQCIDSIVNQSYRNLEIILVDDGSQDNCGIICDEYAMIDNRIHVIHKGNGGVSDARNVGLDAIHGDYVAFVDSDDWIEKDFFWNFMQNQSFDIAYAGCSKVTETDIDYIVIGNSGIYNRNNFLNNFVWQIVHNSLFGYACAKIYSTNVIGTIRFENIPFREDLIFNLKVFDKVKNICLLNNCDYNYRQRNDSSLHKKYSGKIPDTQKVAKYIIDLVPVVEEKQKIEMINFYLKNYYTDIIFKCIFQNLELSQKEKINEIEKIFNNVMVRKKIKFFITDSRLFKVFTICYKLNIPYIYYFILKRILR